MECHDVRLLLAFSQRKCEALDADEGTLVQQHLEKCPDCAAIAQAERGADDALGAAMRDVPVPADLRQKVLKRLARERGISWNWVGRGAIAAAVLLVIGGAGWWYSRPLPSVTFEEVRELAVLGVGKNEKDVELDLKKRGLNVKAPTKLDFELDYKFLQQVDIVEFKGRRVAKLSFFRSDSGNGMALAEVLILPHKQFRVDELPKNTDFEDTITIRIRQVDGFTYLIFSRGEFGSLLHQATQ